MKTKSLALRPWKSMLAVLIAASAAVGAAAQPAPSAFADRWQVAQAPLPKPQPARSQPAQPQSAPAQPALPISLEQALYLIRATILRLNDANHSGNYTVLRDLSAPDFRAK